jgi:HK97 family phage major capsid protein
MSTLNELYGQRDKLDKEAEEIHGRAESESRDLTQDDMIHLDRMKLEKDTLERQIKYKEDQRKAREEIQARRSSVGRDHADLSGPLDGSGRHGPSVGHEERSGYGFAGLGEVLQALAHERRGAGTDSRLRPLEKRAINEGLSSGGGVWIPEQFVDTVFAANPTAAPLTTGATRIDMTTQKVLVPGWVDSSHSASAPYGITWKQIPESGTFGAAQSLSAHAVPLEPKKSGAYFSISNEWLADSSANARRMVETIFTSSLQWYLEKCCWAGTGAGMALGVLNSGSLLDLDKETIQAADTVITQNVVKMRSRIMPGTYGRCF